MPIYITNFWTKLRNKAFYESYDLKHQTYPLNVTIPNLGQFIPVRVLHYNYEYEQHKMMQYRLPHYEIPLQASVRTLLPLYIFLLMLQIWSMHVPRWPTIQRRSSKFFRTSRTTLEHPVCIFFPIWEPKLSFRFLFLSFPLREKTKATIAFPYSHSNRIFHCYHF